VFASARPNQHLKELKARKAPSKIKSKKATKARKLSFHGPFFHSIFVVMEYLANPFVNQPTCSKYPYFTCQQYSSGSVAFSACSLSSQHKFAFVREYFH
jgi:hypothetical protein